MVTKHLKEECEFMLMKCKMCLTEMPKKTFFNEHQQTCKEVVQKKLDALKEKVKAKRDELKIDEREA